MVTVIVMLLGIALAPLQAFPASAAPSLTAPAVTGLTTSAAVSTQLFSYTGSPQSWTVPAGVTQIGVDAQGAQGGGEMGGLGSWAHGVFPVTPGQTLTIYVGGAGSMGIGGFNGGGNSSIFNGGGGGGASDVRTGAATLNDRIIVGAGGGGVANDGSSLYGQGGVGGGTTGGAGGNGTGVHVGGGGGTQTGGAGFGVGGSMGCCGGGGGGGGGYYGGAAGEGDSSGGSNSGGGGGSSYVAPSGSGASLVVGTTLGAGKVIISTPPQKITPTGDVTNHGTYHLTGSRQYYRVPDGVPQVGVIAHGAGGWQSSGGLAQGLITVIPGQVISVFPGGQGTDTTAGYNGGGGSTFWGAGTGQGRGGGGGSDVRVAGTLLSDRAIVAGGGGGAAVSGPGAGGNGGGLTGADGGHGTGQWAGGGGGTQSSGGSFGGGYGGPGRAGVGGAGSFFAGAGGGGYYGGGGGGGDSYGGSPGGGGGGSSYFGNASGGATAAGTNPGDGSIDITAGSIPGSGLVGGPLTPGELYGNGYNPAEVCLISSQGCKADPIDTGTGNFSHTWNDISIPGRGVPLSLSRTYNSGAAPADSPFGFGWSFTYGLSLSITGSIATVNQENGSQVIFTQSGSNYSALPRVQAALVKNGDGSYTFTRRAKQIFTFDSAGALTTEKDLNGYGTTISHPSSSTLKVTDPAGRSLTFTLSGTHIVSLSDPIGRSETFTYDGSGNLTDVIDPGKGHWQFAYDASHRMVTMREPKFYGDTTTAPTPVTTNHYDAVGRVDSQTDQLGRVTRFDYTSIPESTRVTDPKGNITVDTYQYGLRVSTTKGYGTLSAATWSFVYDPAWVGLTLITDPNGHASTSTYDANGNKTSSTDALGHRSSATYDLLNDQTSVTDANNVTTTATYNAAGNLLTTSTPLNGSQITTTYTYGDTSHPGDITKITDPNGQATNATYDRYGNPTSSQDAVGNKTTFTYNTTGWLLIKTAPKGNVPGVNPASFTTTYDHDQYGRIVSIKDPLWNPLAPTAHRIASSYDQNGNLVSTTDGNGHATTYIYDPANEQTSTTRPDGTKETTSYWPDGALKTQTDGQGHTTSYAYDQLARLTSTTDPLNRTTSYTYDPAGNPVNKADPGGTCTTSPSSCTTYTYDKANRLTGVSYSDGTPAVTYAYDPKGQRTSMTDGTGTTTNTRDSLGRLIAQTNGAGASVGYAYDKANNLTTLTYPGNRTVTRTYDAANRFIAVSDWLGHTNRFTYDPNSNLTSLQTANGVVETGTFDNADQLNILSIGTSLPGVNLGPINIQLNLPIGLGSIANLIYTRDGAGQLTSSVSTGQSNQPAEIYGYDNNSRLTSVNATSLTYDHADNITKTQDSATQAFDNASKLTSRRLNGVTTTYGYDTRGNRTASTTSEQTTTLAYDLANRMKSYTVGATSNTYAYDGDGNRTSKTVNGTTSNFVYSQAEGLSQILSDDTNSYIYGPGGMPVEQINGTMVTYLHQDQLGSTRFLTDQKGGVVGTYSYGVYGTTAAHTGTASTVLRYAGQYLDTESGLYWMRARYYDSTTGQFVTVDPIASIVRSPYSYVDDDPLNASDPSGLTCSSAKCLINDVKVTSTFFQAGADIGALVAPILEIPGEVAGVVATGASCTQAVGYHESLDDCTLGIVTVGVAPGLVQAAKLIKKFGSRVPERATTLAGDAVALLASVSRTDRSSVGCPPPASPSTTTTDAPPLPLGAPFPLIFPTTTTTTPAWGSLWTR